MKNKVLLGTLLILLLLIGAELYFYLVISSPTGLKSFRAILESEPRQLAAPVKSPQDTLSEIRFEKTEKYGEAIFFSLEKSRMFFNMTSSDPNVSFRLSRNGQMTQLSFPEMKKLVESGEVKKGDKAEFILQFSQSVFTRNETLAKEELTIYKEP